jgi:transposase
MVKPYSNDLRERVVGAVQRGATVHRVSARFGVSVSSAVKWHQRYRRTGSVRPGRGTGITARIGSKPLPGKSWF